MRKLQFLFFFICNLVFFNQNCNSQKLGKSILGNWYFYAVDSTKSDPYYFYYTEVFIKKDTIFASSELAGLISPMEFKIYGDSVSYNIQNAYGWKAKIESISQESFGLKILYGDGIKIEKYYKLTDKPNLEDFRNGRVSKSEFYNKFWKRMMSLEKSLGLQ